MRAPTVPSDLLLFLDVHRVLAQPGAKLAELQLLAAHLPPEGVVVIAGLLAHEEHGLDFLLALTAALGHGFTCSPDASTRD
jgi:hypothetical protein